MTSLFKSGPDTPRSVLPTDPAPRPVPKPADKAENPDWHPNDKMTSVGIGGGATAAFIAWVRARFDLEITVEDVALFLPIITFVVGYFTKERLSRRANG